MLLLYIIHHRSFTKKYLLFLCPCNTGQRKNLPLLCQKHTTLMQSVLLLMWSNRRTRHSRLQNHSTPIQSVLLLSAIFLKSKAWSNRWTELSRLLNHATDIQSPSRVCSRDSDIQSPSRECSHDSDSDIQSPSQECSRDSDIQTSGSSDLSPLQFSQSFEYV